MASELPSEIGQFQEFLNGREDPLGSLDEAVLEFREYQRQLADLKEKLRVGLDQCERGEVGPFDAEETKRRLREQLARKGIE